MAEESLKQKTIKGVGWSAIDNVSSFAVTFIVGIILARLLSPEDYGLISIIGIFTAICNSCINAGFSSALIRKKNPDENDYCTAYVTNLSVSVFMYITLFLSAPLIAYFFNHSELIALIRVDSIGIIIGAFSIVQRVRLTKQIDFKSQTKITIIASLISSITGISTAFIGWGVWALVIQHLVSATISMFLLLIFNRWIPKFKFSKKNFNEMFGYGSKLLLSNLLNTLWNNIYQVVIGKFYTPATLGQYSRAIGFSSVFSTNLTGVIQRVTFPVLSEIQDDKQRLKEGYKRMIKTTMLISFFSMMMLSSISKSLTIVLVGEKWLQSAYFLQIICWAGMLYPLHALNLNMLQVQGRSDLFLKLEILKKIIGIVPIALGIFIDIYYMLIGSVIMSLLSYYLNAYYSGPFIGYGMKEQISDIFASFVISLLSAIIAFIPSGCVEIFFPECSWNLTSFIILPIQIVLGLLFFLVFNEFLQLDEYNELKTIYIKVIKKFVKI